MTCASKTSTSSRGIRPTRSHTLQSSNPILHFLLLVLIPSVHAWSTVGALGAASSYFFLFLDLAFLYLGVSMETLRIL